MGAQVRSWLNQQSEVGTLPESELLAQYNNSNVCCAGTHPVNYIPGTGNKKVTKVEKKGEKTFV